MNFSTRLSIEFVFGLRISFNDFSFKEKLEKNAVRHHHLIIFYFRKERETFTRTVLVDGKEIEK